MTDKVVLTQAHTDAQARRQAAADAEKKAETARRSELVGDLLLDTETVVNDDALDHDTRVNRLRAAIDGINGRSAVAATPAAVASTPAVAPASAGSVPFDYDALPEEARHIIDLVAANPGRFKIEEFGAVKDKDFTKLRKDFQPPQARDAGDSSSTSSTQKASAPASAKKADPAKKASDEEPEQAPGEKPSGWARVKTAAKQAAQNAKQ